MSAPAFLSRLRLRRDVSIAAIARVLLPTDENQRIGTAHRLLWSLFADSVERRRDFLWREIDGERLDRLAFLVLSARPPEDEHRLFEIDPPKPFMPQLAPGDRLGFSLRANPVVSRWREEDGRRKQKHDDVVMDRLRTVPEALRAERRPALIEEAGRAWLDRQGERCGFRVIGQPSVDGYEQRRIPRDGHEPVRFSTLDFDGAIEVTDPGALVLALGRGFGKARAWGCGLMLVRRVP